MITAHKFELTQKAYKENGGKKFFKPKNVYLFILTAEKLGACRRGTKLIESIPTPLTRLGSFGNPYFYIDAQGVPNDFKDSKTVKFAFFLSTEEEFFNTTLRLEQRSQNLEDRIQK